MENDEKFIEKEKEEKSDTKPKKCIILPNKTRNFLINLISYLINNRNNFEEKIKPSDLEFKLETDSDISLASQLIFKLSIYYSAFNHKRDIIKNMKKYEEFPTEVEENDEYYKSKTMFKNIKIDFFPRIKKGINLDLSVFPFYSFTKESDKKVNIFKVNLDNDIGKDKDNKYTLCFYLFQNDKNSVKLIDEMIENLNKVEMWEFFKKIYVIFQVSNKEIIKSLSLNENINKYIYNEKSAKDNKIVYLFNCLSNYAEEDNNETVMNIFQTKKGNKNKNKDYFFILDSNNKIIKLKPILNLSGTISYFLMNLKDNKNKDIFKEKEKKKIEKFKKTEEIIYFISKLKNLDYIFDIEFDISINICINDDLTDIKIKKINSLKISGEFCTKEYKYLKELFFPIRQLNCVFNILELPTIDIDIDFSTMKCQKCKKEIPNDGFIYYCYTCKDKYCYACVQEQLKNKGLNKYIDKKHNLLFFKTREKKQFLSLDKPKLGKNRFAEWKDDGDFDRRHSAECNGCHGDFNGTERYICLNCRKGKIVGNGFIDYCGKCIEKMCNNVNNDMANLEQEANGVLNNYNNKFIEDHKIITSHKHENHIYLMLPLQYNKVNNGPYYDF
jgi:hypothetical protein